MDPHNDELNDVENGELEGMGEEELFSSGLSERTISVRQPLLRHRSNTTSQIAIVGANICPIESLDYEIIENELFKQDWRSRKKVQIFQYVFLKWAFALLIGLCTGLVGIFNSIAIENIAGFKLSLTNNLMSEGNTDT